MTPRPLALLASAALVVAPRPAAAWSANGHRAVALIAAARLSDAAKQAVAAILGPGVALDAIAPCADDIRGRSGFDCAGLQLVAEPQSEPWHFVDAPISATPASGADLEAFCPNGACVIDQIRAAVKTLQDPSSTQAQKQVALMFLVHFAGDEHQPLHCSNEIVAGVNDRGGNLKAVTFQGANINLHALWDHQIQPSDVNDPVATSARLLAALQGQDVSSWVAGDFVADAAFESFTLAKTVVYPAYYASDPKSLGADYQAKMTPIVDQRLERAGVRLAALLESALVGMPPAAAPVPVPPATPAGRLEKAKRRVKQRADDATSLE
jgi:hypothetical protein